jgi:hypothetical protein
MAMNDGLSGEVLHQRNLLVSEWPDFLSVDQDCPDQCVVLDHWHGNL